MLITRAETGAGDGLAGPPGAQHLQYVFEVGAAVTLVVAERNTLSQGAEPRHKGQQQSALAHPVELRELFRQPQRITPERHDVGAEFEAFGARRGVGQMEQRVALGAERNVRQPQGIEAQRFAVREVIVKTVLGQRRGRGCDGETDFLRDIHVGQCLRSSPHAAR